MVATKTVPVQPSPPPVVAEKAQPVIQPSTPVHNAVTFRQPSLQGVAAKETKAVREQRKVTAPPAKNETTFKDVPTPVPSQQLVQGNEPKIVISSVDHEKINAMYNDALKETERGNVKGAKKLYQDILAEQPGHIEALNNLGVISMREGNTDEAFFYFNKVLQFKKDYGKAYNNIGLLMMRQGQKGLAEEYFRKSIELGKDNLEPSLNLAALFRTEKRYEDANRLLTGFINGNIKNKSLYLSYALVKDEMGQYEEAIQYYRLYLRESGSAAEKNEVAERLKVLENVQSTKNR
jgi:Tfp pilus assembly protein PilF